MSRGSGKLQNSQSSPIFSSTGFATPPRSPIHSYYPQNRPHLARSTGVHNRAKTPVPGDVWGVPSLSRGNWPPHQVYTISAPPRHADLSLTREWKMSTWTVPGQTMNTMQDYADPHRARDGFKHARHLMPTSPATGLPASQMDNPEITQHPRSRDPHQRGLMFSTKLDTSEVVARGSRQVGITHNWNKQLAGRSTMEFDQPHYSGYLSYHRFHGMPAPWRCQEDGMHLITFPKGFHKPSPMTVQPGAAEGEEKNLVPPAPEPQAKRDGPWFSSEKRFNTQPSQTGSKSLTFERPPRTQLPSKITAFVPDQK